MKTNLIKTLGILSFLYYANVGIAQIVVTETHNDAVCNGGFNGMIQLVASGGTPPYQYVWPDLGITIPEVYNLNAGTYCGTVTDAVGETATFCVTISEPDPIQITHNQIVPSCPDQCTGSITVTASGGIAPFEYDWGNGPSNLVFIYDICAGDYALTVVDANGCVSNDMINVGNSEILIGLNDIGHATDGVCNGFVEPSVSGTLSPFFYEWSVPNQGGIYIYDLCPGSYSLTVLDSNSCQESATFEIGSSYDGATSFVDTLNPIINTCLFLNTNPIDSALIYDYNLVGVDSIQLHWIFWQAGSSVSLDMTLHLETQGSNLVFLEINCSGSKSVNSSQSYTFYGNFDTQTLNTLQLDHRAVATAFPNPTTGLIKVSGEQVKYIDILSTNGSFIERKNNSEFNLSAYPKGIYFLKVISKDQTSMLKVVLE